MLNKELIGLVSGVLVVVSAVPYAIRTHQGKVHPNITSWSLWTLIGLAVLLTYRSAGAQANVWPAVFGFVNPLLVTVIAVRRRSEHTKLNKLDWLCLVFGLIALAMWLLTRQSKVLVQYALYVALVADSFAYFPTLAFIWKSPEKDRPFAWGLFAFGYGLNFFAISDYTFANMILPVYMCVSGLCVTAPLCAYRVRKRLPAMEWI